MHKCLYLISKVCKTKVLLITLLNVTDQEDPDKLEQEVLRKNFSELSRILIVPSNLSAIAMDLYNDGLISYDTLQECNNDCRAIQARSFSLLSALKATIDTKPQLMGTLIEVLKRNEASKDIADKMETLMSSY